MKLEKLIAKLQEKYAELGDLDVMFQDPNSDGGPFAIENISAWEAGEDEFPKHWNMPEGFQYILLQN